MTKDAPARGARPDASDASGDPGDPARVATEPAPRRRVRSCELFGASRELTIEHNGEIYSLRQTSKGKLILTK